MGVLLLKGEERPLIRFMMTFVVVLGVLASIAGSVTRADAASSRPLDHHATVINGKLVGSAFAISSDVVLTNAHVVKGRRPGDQVKLVASNPRLGQAMARVIAISSHMDVALLAVPDNFLPKVSGRDAKLKTGMTVTAAGINASGGAGSGQRLQASGRIVNVNAYISTFGPGVIAVLGGVQPGFSGGPLLDQNGRLVGMVTAIRDRVEGGGQVQQASRSGFTPVSAAPRQRRTREAYVIRARELRAEVNRLLRGR